MDNEWSQPYTTIAVSRQLFDSHQRIQEAMMQSLLHPPTAEERAAQEAARCEEWDEKTAKGFVGIFDYGDYEYGPDWRVEDRGNYIEKWVPQDAWRRYVEAKKVLTEAEEALDIQ